MSDYTIVDDRTKRLDLTLPHEGNELQDDVPRLRESFKKIDAYAVEADAATAALDARQQADAKALAKKLEIETTARAKADAALNEALQAETAARKAPATTNTLGSGFVATAAEVSSGVKEASRGDAPAFVDVGNIEQISSAIKAPFPYADFNTYTKSGRYMFEYAENIPNKPTSLGGILEVTKASDTRIIQRYTVWQNGAEHGSVYTRGFHGDNEGWGPWRCADKVAYITGAWRSEDGLAWYRKWSDGFIEQGGFVRHNPDNFTWVNLYTPFTTPNYTVIATLGVVSGPYHAIPGLNVFSDSHATTGFSLFTLTQDYKLLTYSTFWRASGF